MILAFIEGLVLSFILLLVCVINIKNGPVGGVHYYEEPVKERVVEMAYHEGANQEKHVMVRSCIHVCIDYRSPADSVLR